MLDYRPNIKELNTDKLTRNVNNIKFIDTESNINNDIINKFYKRIELNSTANAISKTNNLRYIEKRQANDFINENEKNNFNDILDYESQNDRITSVVKEVEKLEQTLSIMMYGEVVSPEIAKEKDDELFNFLKETDKANNSNLINVSKMLIIINEHINSIEKHIEGISYINEEISDFSKIEKTLKLSDEEINSIQLDSKVSLENSLYTSNYISDKSVINNHLIKLYNDIVDYNICNQAINKIDSVNNVDKTSITYDKEYLIKKDFIDLIKAIEYSSIQSDKYLDNLRIRFDLVKVLYNYEKGVF